MKAAFTQESSATGSAAVHHRPPLLAVVFAACATGPLGHWAVPTAGSFLLLSVLKQLEQALKFGGMSAAHLLSQYILQALGCLKQRMFGRHCSKHLWHRQAEPQHSVGMLGSLSGVLMCICWQLGWCVPQCATLAAPLPVALLVVTTKAVLGSSTHPASSCAACRKPS